MEKWEIRPPLPQKPLNRSSPKFAWVITSGTPIPMQNFITIRLTPFAPQICENAHQVTRLVFFGASDTLQRRPLHRFSRSMRQMTRFRARMCLLGSRKQNFTFRPHFTPKPQIFGQFLTGLRKFPVKKALTMGMHACKLPLMVIVAQ